MSKKKSTKTKQVRNPLAKAKKMIKDLKDQRMMLAENAYLKGYSDAIIDFDKKASAMEKFLDKAMMKFEIEYEKKLIQGANKKRKSSKKRKTKKTQTHQEKNNKKT